MAGHNSHHVIGTNLTITKRGRRRYVHSLVVGQYLFSVSQPNFESGAPGLRAEVMPNRSQRPKSDLNLGSP